MPKPRPARASQKLDSATIEALDDFTAVTQAIDEAKRRQHGNELGRRPKGAFTAGEYANRPPICTYACAWAHLSREVHKGNLEKFTVREVNEKGELRATTVFRPKKKDAE